MPDIAPIENPQSTQPLDDAAIARLQNDLPDDEILYDLAELFRVFGDSTRIKILYALFESELCVNDIAQVVGISQSAVSHQLRVLPAGRQSHLLLAGRRPRPQHDLPRHGPRRGVIGSPCGVAASAAL